MTHRQCYMLDVFLANSKQVLLGVAAAESKSVKNCYSSGGSMMLYSGGGVFVGGERFNSNCKLTSGDRLQVRLDLAKKEVEWSRVSEPAFLFTAKIPKKLSDKPLFPCVEFDSKFDGSVILL